MITAPTESRSRLSARAKVFCGNSIISPCIASESPWTRAMPSVSDTTVPCVRTSAPVSRFRILLLMSSLISDGFNCMAFPSRRDRGFLPPDAADVGSGSQMVRHRLELALDRAVDHRIADGDPGPADQRAVDADGGLDPLAEAPLERALELGELALGDREGAHDARAGETFVGILQCTKKIADLRDESDPVGADQHPDEVATIGIEPVAADREKQGFLVAHGEFRVVQRRAHPKVVRNRGRDPEHLRPDRQRVLLACQGERRFGVGSGNGDLFGHRREALELFLQRREKLRMRLRIDLALENLARARYREVGDLVAQGLFRARDLLLDLRLRRGEDAIGFRLGIALCLVDGLVPELLALRDDVGGSRLRLGQHLRDLLFGPREALAALFARGETVGDLLLTFSDRAHQDGPDEPGAKPDEEREDGGLHEQGQVDVHVRASRSDRTRGYFRPAGISGFAYANSMAMPSPMMNDASIRPSSRNTFA